jgi:hypothetical protein
MARIRSVHPGLFTDEAFAQLSDAAQIFWIGLWTEADDQGVFEWKPITLKMRLRGASTSSVEPLLAELTAAGCICRFTAGSRTYGAVRNFCKFQRPKKPNSVHPLPPEIGIYVSSREASTEPEVDTSGGVSPPTDVQDGKGSEPEPDKPSPVTHQLPTGGGKSSQMEDGGGRRKEGIESKNPPTPQPASEPEPDAGAGDVRQAFDAWNALAAETGLAAARKLDPDRARKIGRRLRENGGLPAWTEALDAIRRSPFLRGETGKDWRATLDFVCQASSYRKLIEGAYSSGNPAPQAREEPRRTASNAARDRLLAAYPDLAEALGCAGAQGPAGWWGAADWIATVPDIVPGTVQPNPALGLLNPGARMPSLNGYLLPQVVFAVCEAAGIPENARPRLDAIAGWCRHALNFDAPAALAAIRRQATRMRDQGDEIVSLAVFERAIRGALAGGVSA